MTGTYVRRGKFALFLVRWGTRIAMAWWGDLPLRSRGCVWWALSLLPALSPCLELCDA
jgi:hypothetical protein